MLYETKSDHTKLIHSQLNVEKLDVFETWALYNVDKCLTFISFFFFLILKIGLLGVERLQAGTY